MNARRLPYTAAVALAGCLALAALAQAAPAVSNMANPDPVYYDLHWDRLATSFTTGPAPAVLSSIRVQYFCDSSSMITDGGLWTDAGGQPGTALELYPVQSFPNRPPGTGAVTFSSAGLELAPLTTYWFVFHNDTDTFWLDTSDFGQTSDYGWTIGDATLAALTASSWSPASTPFGRTSVGRMEVNATILPEPAAFTFATTSASLMLFRRRPRSGACR